MDQHDYRVVGVRGDGTVIAKIRLESLTKARLFANMLRWQDEHVTVTITGPNGIVDEAKEPGEVTE